MPKKSHVDLSKIDDHLLDGLDFCSKVYDLFEQISRGPDGKKRLRLRQSNIDKRLVEELLPLARYIQTRYGAGRRIKVRWLSGSQSYDAILWSSGSLVEHGEAPRKLIVEITSSVHPNDHLRRRRLHEHGGSFDVRGIRRVGAEIVSEPYVFCGGENARALAQQILGRLGMKARKQYPPSTVLIVNCIPNCLILDDEWADAVEQVKNAGPIEFREVFLLDIVGRYTATLYGRRQRVPQRKRPTIPSQTET
jgi:hypothetical protein